MAKMSNNTLRALDIAQSIAEKNNSTEVDVLHLYLAFYSLNNSVAQSIIMGLGISPLHIKLEIAMLPKASVEKNLEYSDELQDIIYKAEGVADYFGSQEIYTEHLLLASLLDEDGTGRRFFSKLIPLNSIFVALSKYLSPELLSKLVNGEESIDQDQSAKGSGKSSTQIPKELKDLGVDYTQRARENKIDPVIGRESEIERLTEILCRKTKNNPCLIGEPGVGKSAIAEGLAKRIADGNVPDLLKDKIIFSLDVGSLMAGTKYRGELEQRLKDAIEAIIAQGNIIVFIDEIHTLAQAGGKEGEVTPSDMLKPYLARGELQTIGATTTDEYRKFIEKDKALERRFQPIIVNPPTTEQTIEILKGIRAKYEDFHKIKITDEAIEAAVNLSDRYISDRFLPDKAIDLIDEASSRAKINVASIPQEIKDKEKEYAQAEQAVTDAKNNEDYNLANEKKIIREKIKAELEEMKSAWAAQNPSRDYIGAEDVAEVVARWTKIPVTRLTETELQRLNNLEEILHNRVIGQDEAVASVSKAIRRARAGLHDPSRPIGTFLFLGPTGVGKTELTKAVAEAMFDSESNIVRIDMSEYMEAHSVSKLIGSPPGYVGFDDGGQLTEQVRRKPYTVVLFDEIEKAHPDVYNLLLQLLDEGRLTDSKGRLVNFKNTIIIMTSNVGISDLKKQNTIGFGNSDGSSAKSDKEVLQAALKRQFKPEFLNRIDVICYFNRLGETEIRKIADLLLKKVVKKLEPKHISVRLTPKIVDYVIKNGYDPEFGARPLRRIIEQTIEDTLAEGILSGKVTDGSTATLDYDGEKIVLV
ncbi:MAG: ATP-dependent Clp protease ATP-binding subunit [Clostridia bacterium]|nr:ATP-dependent Clp protease ATP-binding subunit [Clostridia bacterium]